MTICLSIDDTPSLDDVVATITYGVVDERVDTGLRDGFLVFRVLEKL